MEFLTDEGTGTTNTAPGARLTPLRAARAAIPSSHASPHQAFGKRTQAIANHGNARQGRLVVVAIVSALTEDPQMAEALAEAVAPYLGVDRHDGWIPASEAVAYMGLGSLDALDRAVRSGLPCGQPHGPGGRRYFSRSTMDHWMEGNV